MQTSSVTASNIHFGTDGLQLNQKIVDLTHIKADPPETARIVSIVPMRGQPHLDPRISFTSYPKDGVTYGLPEKILENGTIQCRRITVNGSRNFNTGNLLDQQMLFLLKNHPACKGSKSVIGIPKRFEISDPEEISVSKIATFREKRNLSLIIDDMSDIDLKDFARTVIPSVDDLSISMVRTMMYEKIEQAPDIIRRRINNKPMTYALTVFNRSLAAGHITFAQDSQTYVYKNGFNLGSSADVAATKLLQEKELLAAMNNESIMAINKDGVKKETAPTMDVVKFLEKNTQTTEKEHEKEKSVFELEDPDSSTGTDLSPAQLGIKPKKS